MTATILDMYADSGVERRTLSLMSMSIQQEAPTPSAS